MRIVSLVPSLTHMVCDLGLREALVGCTVFCVEPKGLAKSVAMVGGTKDPDLAKIRALAPSVILVNEEENKPEHIRACGEIAETVLTFPKAPADVPAMLRELGAKLGVAAPAERAAQATEVALADLRAVVAERTRAGTWRPRRFLYYIWREPYMVVASDTYISEMLSVLGFVNVAPGRDRYPTLPVEEAASLGADLLLLSSEPYPFRKRDAERLRDEWPGAPEILKIDGQQLSWYGTMTLEALHAMRRWVDGGEQTLVKPL